VTSRRTFLKRSTASLVAAPISELAFRAFASAPDAQNAQRGFIDVTHPPDAIRIQTPSGTAALASVPGVHVRCVPSGGALRVELSAPATEVRRIGLRWNGDLSTVRLVLGDAWERGYGDFEWRSFVPDRVMPWYAATFDGTRTHAYGVRTSPAAFCSWFVDAKGVSLWMDVRSGAAPLALGERTLVVADVISRAGNGESPFAALRAFCRMLCPDGRTPAAPVFGSNDWYYAYGKNSAQTAYADAEHVAELSPAGNNRPFCVIDDGWQPGRGQSRDGAGMWDHGNEKFGDMAAVAAGIAQRGARPGIWVRPLQAPANAPDAWRLARDRNMLDPTVSAVREKIASDVARIRSWGFAMLKHDYTTFDVFGRWGYQMGSAMTRDGWTFAEGPKRTTAEVIRDLYATIRGAAGDATIIGCNTVSHLSAGVFELCRIGDDTSGTEWARTRKMGVNSLAFRGAQHGAFYAADADCVGVTRAVPWASNRQWLDLVARSGTALFLSLSPDALGGDERRDIRAALAAAAAAPPVAEPLDWQRTAWPERWMIAGKETRYDWGPAEP